MRPKLAILTAIVAIIVLSAGVLLIGSVNIPPADVWRALTGSTDNEIYRVIVVETRLSTAITALLAGAALAVSGLLLQTAFNNPLAGPSILGVSTGASFGVAIAMLAAGGAIAGGFGTYLVTVSGAGIGAGVIILILLALSRVVKSTASLLIAGIMVGYFASSGISLLNFNASREGLQMFVVWGLGSFSGVTLDRMTLYAVPILALLCGSLLLIKPLDALLLGERYATSMGVRVKAVRAWLLTVSGLLTAVVTAFCGPIGFLGLIVPHIARMLTGSSSHVVLLPATALTGGATALLCSLLSVSTAHGVIPINALTPIIGVPVVLYLIINRKQIAYFN